MEYPLISEYREAILSAEDNFNELTSLRPVLDSHGDPVMSSGNFAVVFKMKDENDGKLYAVKCFIKDQEGRDESYKKIADELEVISSSYILPLRYLENELFVDSAQCDREEFPVVVMEWVEGETLDVYLKRNLNDKYELEMLSYRFNRMAAWLLTQPFAHGDLKPDNILVRKDGSLVLVDYDGMFVPSMKGEKAREIGSPDYRHPLRTDSDFNEHIDDFSIAVIALSLKAISLNPQLNKISTSDALILNETDIKEFSTSKINKEILNIESDQVLYLLYGAFYIALSTNSLNNISFKLFMTVKPQKLCCTGEFIRTDVSELDLAEAIKDEFGVKYSKDGKRLLEIPLRFQYTDYNVKPNTKVICENAFNNASYIKHITIPDSVEIIGDSAFRSLTSLQSILISNSVKKIGNSAFEYCINLKTINLPNSIIFIGDYAFKGCRSLRRISIPDSIQIIGSNPFLACPDIEIFFQNTSNFSYDDQMLIDNNGTLISCQNKGYIISVPNTITTIGDSAFAYIRNLASIVLPKSIITIGNSAFTNCESLKNITLHESVTHIGENAFAGCEALQTIIIPNSVTVIRSYAFCGCKSLKKTYIPDSLTEIGINPFLDCPNVKFENSIFSNIRIINNMLIDARGTLISCGNQNKYIEIPNMVVSIGKNSFWGCKTLENITIPNSVITIGDEAFAFCSSLRSITIPKSVKLIGSDAFFNCSIGIKIIIESKNTKIADNTYPTPSYTLYEYKDS